MRAKLASVAARTSLQLAALLGDSLALPMGRSLAFRLISALTCCDNRQQRASDVSGDAKRQLRTRATSSRVVQCHTESLSETFVVARHTQCDCPFLTLRSPSPWSAKFDCLGQSSER